MARTDFDQYVNDNYERIIAEAGEAGCSPNKAIDQLVTEYFDQVDLGQIEPFEQETPHEQMLRRAKVSVKVVRRAHRDSMREARDYFIGIIRGDNLLGRDDPMLNLSFPVGDGTDKTMKYWSILDQDTTVQASNKNRHEVDKADDVHTAQGEEIKTAHQTKGAILFGDLFQFIDEGTS